MKSERGRLQAQVCTALALLVSCAFAGADAQLAGSATAPDGALYQRWLNEDVRYIIFDAERNAFQRLRTDDEREQFIEQFWRRRDPTPDTIENEYREEHYRLIAYANDQFTSVSTPGWKTNRGMIYIKFGRPDEREQHPSGEADGPPFEKWRYRYIEGIGNDLAIEFVDTSSNGDYRMVMDSAEKEALASKRGFGLASSGARDPFADLPTPSMKYRELDAAHDSAIKYNQLPMQAAVEYVWPRAS